MLVAAVAAALAAVMDKPPEAFRVRAVRAVEPASGGPSLWSLYGRQAQMAGRRLSIQRKGSRG